MEKREISVKDGGKWQVIVLGGGPAGCAAAIASAREGKDTLLIEATMALGGMGTMVLVPWWCSDAWSKKSVYGGIAGKIIAKSQEYVPVMPTAEFSDPKIQAEAVKRIYDEEVTASGAKILFGTLFCQAKVEDGEIREILTANKNGMTVFRADVFIDATGDADLCADAGAAVEMGRENNRLQSATHCFAMANVDTFGYEYGLGKRMNNAQIRTIEKHPEFIAAKLYHDPELDLIRDGHFCNVMVGPGVVGFNAGHIEDVKPLDSFWMSEKIIQGRQLARQFEKGLKKYAPEAFGNAWLVETAALLGIRESRRVVCDYMMKIEDYVERCSFEDEIGRTRYMVDVHRSVQEQKTEGENPEVIYRACGEGESVGIPYRSLIPQNIQNLLVAGRCIGTDSLVNGSIRVMPVCLVTGEAAGTAAALSVDCGGNPRKVNVSVLQKKLEAYGACLHQEENE